MDIHAIRSLFPVVKDYVFLNNAAESPLNTRVQQALDEYVTLALHAPHSKQSPRSAVRGRLARLLGGSHADYALVTSTGTGIGLVANGYPWKPGDNVVLPANEHWNNTYPWLALREKGVEIRLVEPGEDERVRLADFEAAMDKQTRLVACAAVRFNSGFRADLRAISEIAHAHGALFLVDAIQAAGVLPLDVQRDGIDIMSAAAFKWLLGLPGCGFLYLNEKARSLIVPTMPGMFAGELSYRELRYFDDSRKYETGTLAYPLLHAWTAGLDLLLDLGIENIQTRVLELTGRLAAGLASKNISLRSPMHSTEERSALVCCCLGSTEANTAAIARLAGQKVIVAQRDGIIRVSPNFYNTEAEIDQLLSYL